jgi:tetratricopeptide (TPR) repeat protein
VRDCILAFALLALGAGPACAGKDSDALAEIGMQGEWAIDCRLPPGPTNQHLLIASSEPGEPTLLIRTGERELATTIRDVQSIAPGRVRWTQIYPNGITYSIVSEKAGERFRSVESIGSDGKTYIRNGYMADWGRGTPWLEKCASSSATSKSFAAKFAEMWQGCSQARDRDRAIRECARLIGIQPNAVLAYNYRAVAYSGIGEFDRAIADFTEAIRLDPQYAEAYNGRAWTYMKVGKAAQGLTDAERSLELRPNDPGILDTRGHIYEALSQREKAVADYRRVLSLLPKDHPQVQETKDILKRLGVSP